MMKRVLTTGIALALTLGMVTPAFALQLSTERISRRTLVEERRALGRGLGTVEERTRRKATVQETGRAVLERARRRAHVTGLGTIKGSEYTTKDRRYRVLNRPNQRNLRQLKESSSMLELPASLVQTGGEGFYRPTRRTVIDEARAANSLLP